MINLSFFNLRRRWPVLALAAVIPTALVLGGLRLQALVRAQLPGILKGQLEAALDRRVQFGALHVWPTGVWVDDLRVGRRADESVDPVTAKRLVVRADWWHLIRTRELRVDGIELQGAQVHVAAEKDPSGRPWTEQVQGLSKSGIQRFALRDSSVRLLSSKKGPEAWRAEGISGDLILEPEEFLYRARAQRFRSPQVALSGLELSGAGKKGGLELEKVSAAYQGGTFRAKGTVDTAENDVLLTVRADRVPLAQLAAEIGIPAEWAMKGSVTGDVTVDAHENSLRSVKGTLHVHRGSFNRGGSQFPWKFARAEVDWTPEKAIFREVEIAGDGLLLTAAGQVVTPSGKPFTSGALNISGRVKADRHEAVTRVARLLAFENVLGGRWKAKSASAAFQASGSVGDLSRARATGRVQVDDLQFRPVPDAELVTLSSVQADLDRSDSELRLRNLRAQTGGVLVDGEVILTDDQPGRPGQFLLEGRVDVGDLKSLRKAVPQASLWAWIPVPSRSASGTANLRLGGPTANPADFWTEGDFELRKFRLAADSPLPSGAAFAIPVETASGKFRRANQRLDMTDLYLKAQTFDASGQVALNFATPDPAVDGEFRINTEDWRALPAMPVGAMPELEGGRMDATIRVSGPFSKLDRAPVEGAFRLTDATYRVDQQEARAIPVRELSAQFLWADRVLQLPYVSVDSPLMAASAAGRIYPDQRGDYHMALDVEARSDDAGELAKRFTEEVELAGGTAVSKLHMDAPVDRFEEAVLTGTMELKDTQVLQPARSALAEYGFQTIDARTLDVDFTRSMGRWDMTRLALDGPALQLAMKGSVTDGFIDADLRLSTDRWTAPESVPVVGGKVTLEGRLRGEPEKPKSMAFAGAVRLDGARVRYASKQVKVADGLLTLSARGQGNIGDVEKWLASGDVRLEKVALDAPNVPVKHLDLLTGSFSRDGDTLRVRDARITAGEITAAASGEWHPKRHALAVTAETADLAQLGIRLPDGLDAQRYRVVARIGGNRDNLVEAANGSVAMERVRLEMGGLPAQEFSLLAGEFNYRKDLLRVEKLEGRGPAGVITADGEWSPKGHRISLVASGEDFKRLKVALPDGFSLQDYHLKAEFSGDAKQPLASGSGTAELANARVPFGPHGPHLLNKVATRFEVENGAVKLEEIRAQGPGTEITGTGVVANGDWSLKLNLPRLEPKVATWLVPGSIEGGGLSGTLNLEGAYKASADDERESVRKVSGRFELVNAKYTIPDTLELLAVPMEVARFAGDYEWDTDRTVIRNMVVDGDLVDGQGTLTINGAGRVEAELTSADLGRVADFWPALKGKFRGGSATGKLVADFDAKGTTGTLALRSKGGTLVLPDAPAEFGEHPIEKASVILGFSPGRLTFGDMKIRGPKGNLDGSGVWHADGGPVSAKGKTWFAKGFTSKLIKPSGWGWFAKLIGFREIKTDFELTGTSDQVMLKAGITRSLLWKFMKGRVPKHLQEVASGKKPLWQEGAAEQDLVGGNRQEQPAPDEPAGKVPAAPEPAEPAGPGPVSAAPVKPVDRKEPVEPVQPVDRKEPVQPVQPENDAPAAPASPLPAPPEERPASDDASNMAAAGTP